VLPVSELASVRSELIAVKDRESTKIRELETERDVLLASIESMKSAQSEAEARSSELLSRVSLLESELAAASARLSAESSESASRLSESERRVCDLEGTVRRAEEDRARLSR
jgi:hypothetical protein